MSTATTTQTHSSLSQLKATVAAQLKAMSARERAMVGLAVAVVAGAFIWLVLLAPAIGILRKAPEQHAALDTKLERMQRWAEQAQQVERVSLGEVPPRSKVLATIQGSRSGLGEGSLITVKGDRAVVQLGPTSAQAFARWLGQMRVNARVAPVDVKIRRVGRNWTGQIELAGPGLNGGATDAFALAFPFSPGVVCRNSRLSGGLPCFCTRCLAGLCRHVSNTGKNPVGQRKRDRLEWSR